MWTQTELQVTQQLKYVSRSAVRFSAGYQQLRAPELVTINLESRPDHHCSLPSTWVVSLQVSTPKNVKFVWLGVTVECHSDLEAHGDPSDLRGRVEQYVRVALCLDKPGAGDVRDADAPSTPALP